VSSSLIVGTIKPALCGSLKMNPRALFGALQQDKVALAKKASET
jgi:hypothetical protein